MGATVGSVFTLLSRNFVKLVIIGTPLDWCGEMRWLESFPCRLGLDAAPFLLAGALAVLIALATVSTQALRAAAANPVQSLRDE